MKKKTRMKHVLASILLFLPLCQGCASLNKEPESPRKLISINEGWQFHKGDVAGAEAFAFSDADWERVDIPHTWNALDGQNGKNDFWTGPSWYRRTIMVDGSDAGREFWVQLDGANLITDVYVNGEHLGTHKGGYAGFRFNCTDQIKVGRENVIAIKVENFGRSKGPYAPISADFTFFGGVYRDVHLLVTDKLAIDADDYGSSGVYLKQTRVSSDSADLEIRCKVINRYDTAHNVTCRTILVDADDKVIEVLTKTMQIFPNGGSYDFVQSMKVKKPHLWNGLADPYLYRAYVQVIADKKIVDMVSQPVGFRFFSMDPDKGFLLNGRPYKLRGVNRHQDRENKGWAISDADMEEDFSLIREMGANTIRVAHYQQDQYWYDLCDKYGMVVWAEIPLVDTVIVSDDFYDNAKQQMRELIRQNYNHPSIVTWSAGNELHIKKPNPLELLTEISEVIKEEDTTRPSTYGSCHGDDSPLNFATDLVAFNKYYGWYSHELVHIGEWLDQWHKNHPDNMVGISEYGAGGNVFHHQENPPKPKGGGEPFMPEEYHCLYHEVYWNAFKSRDYLWGTWIWNMFDFASDHREFGERHGINLKGMVTYDRKIKKDSFFFYKANWTDTPVVHITSRRAMNRSNENVEVKVYSNAESVELLVDGKSIGKQTPSDIMICRWEGLDIADGTPVKATAVKDGATYTDSIVWNR
ncbi:MAG: glycoside hydrolase family 2 protein [Pontiellaceae bacterium]|nr:glycoside hydrolase family 2 protein [Pontiellaceae bacterium]MBN2783484.1 glycoside hydrolase family 2 protein [Pontiellaceae bacterium]